MTGLSSELRGERSAGSGKTTLRHYLLIEAMIGAMINAALTGGFTTLMFAGLPLVLRGVGGLAFDFIPATFLPVLAMSVGLTILTRRRRRIGKTPAVNGPPLPLPANPVLRGILFGGVATIMFGGAGAALMTWWWSADVSFAAVLAFKLAYGAALGAVAAALIVGAALRDPYVSDSAGR